MDGVLFYVAFAFLVFGIPLIVTKGKPIAEVLFFLAMFAVFGVPFVLAIRRMKSRDQKPGHGTAEGNPWQAAADRRRRAKALRRERRRRKYPPAHV